MTGCGGMKTEKEKRKKQSRDTYGDLAGVPGGDALGFAVPLQLHWVRDLVELRLQRRHELLVLHVFLQQAPHLACTAEREEETLAT